ncbi:zinc finger protein 724-like [Schistocerca gregaria]|uniref:zinc finger protein 724-like n=1 Tax=Schistocerca gregaria TaxID=7010 RepID=UPI00211E4236|nr:zinc finger protein 724-like [Schistocerca gregaria]
MANNELWFCVNKHALILKLAEYYFIKKCPSSICHPVTTAVTEIYCCNRIVSTQQNQERHNKLQEHDEEQDSKVLTTHNEIIGHECLQAGQDTKILKEIKDEFIKGATRNGTDLFHTNNCPADRAFMIKANTKVVHKYEEESKKCDETFNQWLQAKDGKIIHHGEEKVKNIIKNLVGDNPEKCVVNSNLVNAALDDTVLKPNIILQCGKAMNRQHNNVHTGNADNYGKASMFQCEHRAIHVGSYPCVFCNTIQLWGQVSPKSELPMPSNVTVLSLHAPQRSGNNNQTVRIVKLAAGAHQPGRKRNELTSIMEKS